MDVDKVIEACETLKSHCKLHKPCRNYYCPLLPVCWQDLDERMDLFISHLKSLIGLSIDD